MDTFIKEDFENRVYLKTYLFFFGGGGGGGGGGCGWIILENMNSMTGYIRWFRMEEKSFGMYEWHPINSGIFLIINLHLEFRYQEYNF